MINYILLEFLLNKRDVLVTFIWYIFQLNYKIKKSFSQMSYDATWEEIITIIFYFLIN